MRSAFPKCGTSGGSPRSFDCQPGSSQHLQASIPRRFHAGWHLNSATGIGGRARSRDNALVVAMDSADAAEHAAGGAASCSGRARAALPD